MTIAEKYRKILEKPMAEPFKGYIEELVAALEGLRNEGVYIGKPNAKERFMKNPGKAISKEEYSQIYEAVSKEAE